MKLVGILNITPDSFSDGGDFASPDKAAEAAAEMMEQGAWAVDIGAESTRPGAVALGPEEEWARLAPVLFRLKGVNFGVDTRHAENAKRAIDMGAAYINDVSGFAADEMKRAAAESGVVVIAMHSLTVPADRNVVWDKGIDPVAELRKWAREVIEKLAQRKIAPEKMVLDPGIGFGKTAEQSLEVLNRIEELAAEFHRLGAKIMVGHSRKSFMKLLTEAEGKERDEQTAILSAAMADKGVDFVRVHNVGRNLKEIILRSIR